MDEAVKRRVRKRKEDAKNAKIQVRMTDQDMKMLEEICHKCNVNPSEALRYCVKNLYYSLRKG